jgi:hypothetical protein
VGLRVMRKNGYAIVIVNPIKADVKELSVYYLSEAKAKI